RTGARLWASRHGENAEDTVSGLAVSPDGSKVFVTGTSFRSEFDNDFLTVAYDASTGAQLWSARYDHDDFDYTRAIAVSPDGSKVFVTGASKGDSTPNDYATVAYDAATGARLWGSIYGSGAQAEDDPRALAVSPDGSQVFVTGLSER